MRKFLVAALACACFFAFQASAQEVYTTLLDERTISVGDFSSISVSDDFEVTLAKGACSARVTTDKVLAPYVQVYVRSRTLYVSYDEKAVPKDVKKLFKGRKAPDPVFRVVVFMPHLSGIELSDNASLASVDELSGAQVSINLTDKALIKSLKLNADDITVRAKKNSQVSMNIDIIGKADLGSEANAALKVSAKAGEVMANAAGSSKLTLVTECRKAVFNTGASAKVTADPKVSEIVEVHMGGSSELVLSGETPQLLIRAEKNSELNASALKSLKVDAQMSGSSNAEVNAVEDIDATLVGGSSLYYTGTPAIRIGKIIKSTLAPHGSSAK